MCELFSRARAYSLELRHQCKLQPTILAIQKLDTLKESMTHFTYIKTYASL